MLSASFSTEHIYLLLQISDLLSYWGIMWSCSVKETVQNLQCKISIKSHKTFLKLACKWMRKNWTVFSKDFKFCIADIAELSYYMNLNLQWIRPICLWWMLTDFSTEICAIFLYVFVVTLSDLYIIPCVSGDPRSRFSMVCTLQNQTLEINWMSALPYRALVNRHSLPFNL